MIIGLTGKNGAGKGEVAEFLKKAGYTYFSLSDALREELVSRKITISRDHLTKVGNELRTIHGPSVLADRILARLNPGQNYVIDSFRNPSEVKTFLTLSDFELWEVMASPAIRFKRMKARARENDPQTYQAFLQVEKREAMNSDPTKQSLDACAKLAHRHLSNSLSLDRLLQTVRESLKRAFKEHGRPNWDTYFMNIARMVANRSNCIKRKVAAVIVKDGRIISTGYNGTPRNTKNCFEGGCARCNEFGPSGKNLTECYCSHGEENAIVQAAYHGIAIKESTLYSTFSPCLLCTKMIINAGVKEVVFNQNYPLADHALKLLKESGVRIRKISIP